MKKVTSAVLALILCASAQATQLAFPGAEGYGCYATGGRGGDVYHVTTLADFNDYKGATETPIPGSLRYGIRTASGPRTIVFDISGYIDLKARLEFGNYNLTIAGQTAPGDGITLRHWDVRLYQAHNVIIRYLRVRPGYFADQLPTLNLPASDPNHLNGGLDCLSIESSTNIVIDHCSLSWSADEIGSVTSDSNDITVQWTFLTEPLNWDSHAYISLMRPAMSGRYTHHHNLYLDCIQRLTRLGNYNNGVSSRFDWVNNVAHNWGSGSYGCTYNQDSTGYWQYDIREGTSSGGTDGELINVNFIKNYFKPASGDYGYFFYGVNNTGGGSPTDSKIWAENNYWNGSDSGWTKLTGTYVQMTGRFSISGPLSIDTAPVAYDRVRTYGGYWLVRDAVDTRLINQVTNGTGAIISTQNDASVGGYPSLNSASRAAGFDTDGDGMPTAWEEARWFDPNDPNDRNTDRDSDGYTNLEEYLNYLVVWKDGAPAGDFDQDNDVDWDDFATFINNWLVYDPVFVPAGDLDGDFDVDLFDYAIFASGWTG